MADYIDKNYVKKCLMESWANSGIPSDAKNKMLKWLNKAPTAADVCPHYRPNRHDRGDDSYCSAANCEVKAVQPVRRGRWEQKEIFEAKGHVEELQSAFCPVCKRFHTTPYSYYYTHYDYCPNCGAKMEYSG